MLCTLEASPQGDFGVCHTGRDIARFVECGSDGALSYERRQVTLTLHFRPGIFADPITLQVRRRQTEPRRFPPLPPTGSRGEVQWTWYTEPRAQSADGFEACTETRNPAWP